MAEAQGSEFRIRIVENNLPRERLEAIGKLCIKRAGFPGVNNKDARRSRRRLSTDNQPLHVNRFAARTTKRRKV